MTNYDIETLKAKKWDELDKLTTSLEETAKNMSRQQKQNYMTLYKVSIYEKIRAFRYILLSDEIDINYFIKNFPSNLRDNLEFMNYATILHPELIKYAGESIVSNYEIGLNVVQVDGAYLECLSLELKNNKEIVKTAVICDQIIADTSFRFASDELKNDKEFIMELLDVTAEVFMYASDELKDDEELAYKACSIDPMNIHYISNRLKENEEFIKSLIINNGYSFYTFEEDIETTILNNVAVELIEEDFINIHLINLNQLDYICSFFGEEYLIKKIKHLKENAQNLNSYEELIINKIDKKINGESRTRD